MFKCSLRAGPHNPYGQNLMSVDTFCHCYPLLQVKTVSLWTVIIFFFLFFFFFFFFFFYIFSLFYTCVYSQGRTHNPLGAEFWCQQIPSIIVAHCCKFQFYFSLNCDFLHSFYNFIHEYSPRAWAHNPWDQNFNVNRYPLSSSILSPQEYWFVFAK